MLRLVITLASVALVMLLISKKFTLSFVFIFTGFLIAAILQLGFGVSPVQATSGNIVLDIFEGFKEALVQTFPSTGLAILPICAYSAYMNKIGANDVMGKLIANPISKSKSPYFFGVFLAVAVCGLLRIAIVSAVAIMALFMTTLYPALLRAGISRYSAMSAIFIGTCFDWGPADFVIAQMFGAVPNFDQLDYFFNASIKVLPIVLFIVASTSGFIFQAFDKKAGYALGSHAPSEGQSQGKGDVPGFYAVLPILPLILIIMFSPLITKKASISILTAVVISLLISVAVEALRKHKLSERVGDLGAWIANMGESFGNYFILIAAIQFFGNMMGKLGGFDFLIDAIIGFGVNGMALLILFGILMFLVCFMIGSGGAIGLVLAPSVPNIAQLLGISFYSAVLPMQVANGMRSFNMGTSIHMQYGSQMAETVPIELFKRMLIPSLIMYASTFALSLLILR